MIEIMSKSHIYKLKVLVSAEVELAVVDRSGSIKKLTKDFFEKI
mgnify:CR=1 FL=1